MKSTEFKSERHVALAQPTTSNGWYAGGDSDGNTVLMPVTRTHKRPSSRLSRRERFAVRLFWTLYLPAALYMLGWLGARLLKAIN